MTIGFVLSGRTFANIYIIQFVFEILFKLTKKKKKFKVNGQGHKWAFDLFYHVENLPLYRISKKADELCFEDLINISKGHNSFKNIWWAPVFEIVIDIADTNLGYQIKKKSDKNCTYESDFNSIFK